MVYTTMYGKSYDVEVDEEYFHTGDDGFITVYDERGWEVRPETNSRLFHEIKSAINLKFNQDVSEENCE